MILQFYHCVLRFILNDIKNIEEFKKLIDINLNNYNLDDNIFLIDPKYYNKKQVYKIQRESKKLNSELWSSSLFTMTEIKKHRNIIDYHEVNKINRMIPSTKCFDLSNKTLKNHEKLEDFSKEYLIKFLWFYEQCLIFFNSSDVVKYDNYLNSKNKNNRYLSEICIINSLYIKKFNNDTNKIKTEIKKDLGIEFENIDQLIDDIWEKELRLTIEYINNKINALKNAINS